MMHIGSVSTPDGDFSVIVRGRAVIASGWTTDWADLLSRVRSQAESPGLEASKEETGFALEAVRAYYDGDLRAIDTVPVHQVASPFRGRAWRALRGIAPGAPITYTELAARAGNPAAVRAAASACAANPAALFVPCHRVVAKGGGLAGFLYGVDVKRRLLAHEAVHA